MTATAPLVVDLDDQRSTNPALSGAKAAVLARARSLGFPVLPGHVVPSTVGAAALAVGARALANGGSGAARLAVMAHEIDHELVEALHRCVKGLGAPVVVRSSSTVEDSSHWAGAFSSFDGIGPDDVRTALRGVWASPFSVEALERGQRANVTMDELTLAVLVQPEIAPEFGGSAKLRGDGSVEVVATEGAPRGLMNGWSRGLTAVAPASGPLSGNAVPVVGFRVLTSVVELTRAVHRGLGQNLIEWAWDDDRVVLLQARRAAEATAAVPKPRSPSALSDEVALEVAQVVRRFPGALGQALVLPWALGWRGSHEPSVEWLDDPLTALDEVSASVPDLAAQVWERSPADALAAAGRLHRDLRGPAPAGALRTVAQLKSPDPNAAERLASLMLSIVETAVRMRVVDVPAQVWQLTPERLKLAFTGEDVVTLPVRSPADRWEPFVYGVVTAHGRQIGGTGVTAGIGAGRVVVVDDPAAAGDVDRAVIIARRPTPALASLLWRASGLVTEAGSAAAHLFEVATSVGVPAVIGVDLEAELGSELSRLQDRTTLAAVDGETGHLWVLDVEPSAPGSSAGVRPSAR